MSPSPRSIQCRRCSTYHKYIRLTIVLFTSAMNVPSYFKKPCPNMELVAMGEWELNSRFEANGWHGYKIRKKKKTLFICVSLSFRIICGCCCCCCLFIFFLWQHLLIPSSVHIRVRIHFSFKCTMCEFDGDLIQGWMDLINHGGCHMMTVRWRRYHDALPLNFSSLWRTTFSNYICVV